MGTNPDSLTLSFYPRCCGYIHRSLLLPCSLNNSQPVDLHNPPIPCQCHIFNLLSFILQSVLMLIGISKTKYLHSTFNLENVIPWCRSKKDILNNFLVPRNGLNVYALRDCSTGTLELTHTSHACVCHSQFRRKSFIIHRRTSYISLPQPITWSTRDKPSHRLHEQLLPSTRLDWHWIRNCQVRWRLCQNPPASARWPWSPSDKCFVLMSVIWSP